MLFKDNSRPGSAHLAITPFVIAEVDKTVRNDRRRPNFGGLKKDLHSRRFASVAEVQVMYSYGSTGKYKHFFITALTILSYRGINILAFMAITFEIINSLDNSFPSVTFSFDHKIIDKPRS